MFKWLLEKVNSVVDKINGDLDEPGMKTQKIDNELSERVNKKLDGMILSGQYRYLHFRKIYANIEPDRESMKKLLEEVRAMPSYAEGFALVELRGAWSEKTRNMNPKERETLRNQIKKDNPNVGF